MERKKLFQLFSTIFEESRGESFGLVVLGNASHVLNTVYLLS